MRKLAIILAIVAQAAALGWVVLERETVLRSDTVVYLRTAPVDPRDVFRGDYVQLSYDINRIPLPLADAQLLAQKNHNDMRVYAGLSVDAHGVAVVDGLHAQPPAKGLYLRGSTTHDWQLRGNNQEIAVIFGIEKMFLEQGAGKLIEQQRGTRNEWQRPLEVAVAVGGNGIGVIRDYRWAQLATRLEVLNQPQVAVRGTQLSPRLRFSIRNASTAPLVLANPGNDCGYVLQAVDGQSFTMLGDECANVVAGKDDVVVLAPGETYVREIDLAQARWHVRLMNGSQESFSGELGHYSGWERFRLIYRSPPDAAVLSTPVAPMWIGSVSSAAFSNRGRVD